MWTKPWKMKEGFLIGGGLIAAGFLLQLLAGPLDWSMFAWPVNLIVLLVLLLLIAVMYLLRRKVYLFEWMMHYGAALPCMCFALGLTVIMGLTVQTPYGGVPWLSQMLGFWPFVLIWTWMTLIAGLAALNHLLRLNWREIPFIINHSGVFIAVTCAALGSADVQQLQMTVFPDRPETLSTDEYGMARETGLTVELHRFIIENHEDGTPKRFASEITVLTRNGEREEGTVEVNRPLKVDGWKIYQSDYDTQNGPESRYSILMIVRDPWLPAVYAGIFMMLAGALCLMFFMAPKTKKG